MYINDNLQSAIALQGYGDLDSDVDIRQWKYVDANSNVLDTIETTFCLSSRFDAMILLAWCVQNLQYTNDNKQDIVLNCYGFKLTIPQDSYTLHGYDQQNYNRSDRVPMVQGVDYIACINTIDCNGSCGRRTHIYRVVRYNMTDKCVYLDEQGQYNCSVDCYQHTGSNDDYVQCFKELTKHGE